MQALYAGAIVVRTFAQRAADGCGARAYFNTGDNYPVENDVSQRYYGSGTVQQYHRDAANQTAGLTILRFSDNGVACAKHFTDVGDPTDSWYDAGQPTDTSVQDDVYDASNTCTTCTNAGIGHNGSSAWSKGPTNTRLNWPQILGKYYTRIGLSAGTNNTNIVNIPKNNFRWAWADVTSSIDYTGYNGVNYHTAKANTPTTMQPNCVYSFPFTVFNGSKVTFYANWGSSANPTRLSYHWYTYPARNLVVWDGDRTYLGTDLNFGHERALAVGMHAPPATGTYYLDWDLVQENVAWYHDKLATVQEIVVTVSGAACP